MKSFFKTLFASTIGVIIGVSILVFLGFFIIIGISMSSGSETYNLKDKTVLKIELDGTVSDRDNSSPFSAFLSDGNEMVLDDIVDAIMKAKENDEIKGIYIKAGNFYSGIANLEPIRKALIEFRKSDKFVVAYSDNYSQGTYYLASTANKVILNPKGHLDFHGLAAINVFVKGLYENLGVKFQVYKVGTYKSAVEPYIQDKMSDANRLQTESFMNSVWDHLLKNISESRNISVEQLNKYADQFLTFTEPDSLLKYKMVDTLMYSTSMEDYLKTLVGEEKDKKLRIATVGNLKSVSFKKESKSKDKIAVLYAEGSILHQGSKPNPLFSETAITAEEYVKELQKLKDDESVKAVVFRVNSPGGSAYASEQIWNAVVELKAVKPVIVSMGTYAASGGYYISCAANSIVAEPTTLTGSIGIFGLIPDGTELAKKMGLSFDEVKTNKHSAFGGQTFGIPFLVSAQSRGFTDDESALLQGYIERGYDLFITRCADGRSKTKVEIDSIGQGRVWTGLQALEIGLVDKIGGLNDAIKIAAETAQLSEYSISKYPAKKDFFVQLMEESMGNSKVKALKFFMGEKEYDEQIMMGSFEKMDFRSAIMSERIAF